MLNVLNELVVLTFRVASQVSFASTVGLFSSYNRSLLRCDAGLAAAGAGADADREGGGPVDDVGLQVCQC